MNNMSRTCSVETFDWSVYEDGWKGGSHLLHNKKIKTSNSKDVVYSRESYAQAFVDKLDGNKTEIVSKDISKGDIVKITDIKPIVGTTNLSVELSSGMNIVVDAKRESKFIQNFGIKSVTDFIHCIEDKENVDTLLGANICAKVVASGSSPRISLWGGMVDALRTEMRAQIKNPSKAYTATIESANKGGYFVDINGVKAFMPGSLAAPNKILDFVSMIGNQVIVMVEDYISDIDSFIVSHKKYINFVLPMKLKELDYSTKYVGSITGTSKFGIFIEFGEMFTGLLHVSKMSALTKQSFDRRQCVVGDTMEFYIEDIKDNRIIMTEESPEYRNAKRQEYIDSITGKELVVSVVNNISSGVLVSHEGYMGLITKESLKKAKLRNTKLIQGDSIRVVLQKVDGDKIYYNIP